MSQAVEIAGDGAVSTDHFTWHPVSRAVGNVKNQGPKLIEAIKAELIKRPKYAVSSTSLALLHGKQIKLNSQADMLES